MRLDVEIGFGQVFGNTVVAVVRDPRFRAPSLVSPSGFASLRRHPRSWPLVIVAVSHGQDSVMVSAASSTR
jgi:hypothetical protein